MKVSKESNHICEKCGMTSAMAMPPHYFAGAWSNKVTKCAERKKCEEANVCFTCCLDGGHIVKLLGNHKWVEVKNGKLTK